MNRPTNLASFVTDDEPESPTATRLHVLEDQDYYLTVSRTEVWPATCDSFRHCLSGTRNSLLGFLIVAIYKLGKGNLAGAIGCAQAFIDLARIESESKVRPS